MNHHLIVVSLLDGKGPTGVEAHFNQLLDDAQAHGIVGRLVSAHPAQRLWATLARQLVKLLRLLDQERAGVLSLWLDGRVLAAKLARLMARAHADGAAVTLYAQDPWSARIALKARAQWPCRVVAVVHYNGSQAEEFVMQGHARAGGALFRALVAAEAQALPQVDHIIFVSAFMRRTVGARMAAIDTVAQSVLPNFIGRHLIGRSPRDDAGAGSRTGDLIAIGTLEMRKNQAFLLQVLARARARGYSYTLTLVGDGPDRARLEALSEQLGLQDQVSFAGFQQQAARLIPRHRMLVHAALMENMPIALIEALAMGRPILAPEVGGIGEIFRHGVEGYFWPLDDVDGAAGLLIAALSDAARYQQLAQAARARYLQKFDSARLAPRWLRTILDDANCVARGAVAEVAR